MSRQHYGRKRRVEPLTKSFVHMNDEWGAALINAREAGDQVFINAVTPHVTDDHAMIVAIELEPALHDEYFGETSFASDDEGPTNGA